MSYRHWIAAHKVCFGGDQPDHALMQRVHSLGATLGHRPRHWRTWYILSFIAWRAVDSIAHVDRDELIRELGFNWRDMEGRIRSLVRLGHLRRTAQPDTYRVLPQR